jgi:hypothetical protein
MPLTCHTGIGNIMEEGKRKILSFSPTSSFLSFLLSLLFIFSTFLSKKKQAEEASKMEYSDDSQKTKEREMPKGTEQIILENQKKVTKDNLKARTSNKANKERKLNAKSVEVKQNVNTVKATKLNPSSKTPPNAKTTSKAKSNLIVKPKENTKQKEILKGKQNVTVNKPQKAKQNVISPTATNRKVAVKAPKDGKVQEAVKGKMRVPVRDNVGVKKMSEKKLVNKKPDTKEVATTKKKKSHKQARTIVTPQNEPKSKVTASKKADTKVSLSRKQT